MARRDHMDPLALGMLQSFYVGGTTRLVDSSVFGVDTQVVGAMYVQRMAPPSARFLCPSSSFMAECTVV